MLSAVFETSNGRQFTWVQRLGNQFEKLVSDSF